MLRKGVTPTQNDKTKRDKYLTKQVKALVIRNIFDDGGFYMIMNEIDPTFLKALEVVQK